MLSRSFRRYAGALACAAPLAASAQDAGPAAFPELDTVTVTASRVPMDGRNQPVAVSVIDAADIAASPARNVQDLLATQAGVHLINTSSAGDNAIVDLRGFGLTGASNTLLLIDGVRQNDNDLSAPMLGSIPMEQIERIEIVRGSGAVQYGGGATGGVINIITRRGSATPSASATVSLGNYGLRQADAQARFGSDKVMVDVYGQTLDTDNYRDNNAERRTSAGMGLTFRHDDGSVRLYARTATQKLGLPGPRLVDPSTGENQYEDDPRGATYPDDYLKVQTDALGIQISQALGRGMLYADLGQRIKDLDGYSNDGYGDTLRDQQLDETSGSVRYQLPFAGGHSLVAGVDGLYSRTDATQQPYYDVESAWRSTQRQYGAFAEGTIRATDSTTLTLGARRQYASDEVAVQSGSGSASDKSRHLTAWQAALRQELGAGFAAYGKVGRSFRLPNADELLSVQTPLAPQTSTDKEIGLTWASAGSSARLAWFRYDLTNEIQYNPLADGLWGPGTGANVNLDPTRRQGVELEGTHALSRTLSVDANLTWMEAEFRSGTYYGVDLAGKRVPLVPRWLANAGLTWRPSDDLFLRVSAQYVGSSRMDNDQANQFDAELQDYVLFNAKAGYRFSRHVEGTLAVNNLFDRDYATYGIRGANAAFEYLGPSARYNLYPGMGRSVVASLTVRY
ncbi:TonB-dependent receptor [Bordetella sp. 2513F-2]